MKYYVLVVSLVGLFVAGCAPSEGVIKGTVVMQTAVEAHLDLGRDSGIKVGDTLTVYREEPFTGHETLTVRVGVVRVTKFIDDRYAAADVLEGSVKKGDRVEGMVKAH